MKAGNLRYRISIERKETFKNDLGEEETSWWTVCTVWAEIRPQSGTERFLAQQVSGSQTKIFVIRYRNDISVGHRIRLQMDDRDQYFNITEVDREGEGYRTGLRLTATYIEGEVY